MNDVYVEKEFDRFMFGLGFKRVSDDVGSSPNFQNADYVHKEDGSIVELKILQKQFFTNGGILQIKNQVNIMVNPIDVDDQGLGQYTFTIPEPNKSGRYNNFEEPLEGILKKANKQLRETRDYYFGNNESYGFVILAQVGFDLIPPQFTAMQVQEILNRKFSSIDGVVICTPYDRTKNPTTMEINPECVSVTKEKISDLMKKLRCMGLADRWVEFFGNEGHIRV